MKLWHKFVLITLFFTILPLVPTLMVFGYTRTSFMALLMGFGFGLYASVFGCWYISLSHEFKDTKKRYTLFRFPSLYGSPKDFNYKFTMYFYAIFMVWGTYAWEYKDNQTEEYRSL